MGRDLADGLACWRLWTFHGWLEVKHRYRRSVLGPFWLTLSMAITVGTLGFVYGSIFKIDLADYLPYLTLGFMTWGLWQNLLGEGCLVFVQMEGFIKQSRMPLSLYVLRSMWVNLIIFAHNFLVFVGLVAILSVPLNRLSLMFIPGLVLLLANAFGLTLILGVACARFRDIQPIVTSILQLAFFASPILYRVEFAEGRKFIVEYNPFFYLIEIVRAPLLGQHPYPGAWVIMTVSAVVLNLLGLLVFARFRRRIAFWL